MSRPSFASADRRSGGLDLPQRNETDARPLRHDPEPNGRIRPAVRAFFHSATGTLTYVAWDPGSRDAIIIDPVLDYDASTSTIGTGSVRALAEFVRAHRLMPHDVFETHAHADHLTASQELKRHFPNIRVAISSRIAEVQRAFKRIFNWGEEFSTRGEQFDLLFGDSGPLRAGTLRIDVLPTPGHTPACTSYRVGDAVFTGDTLFMPDYGVGRCDFPGGSAEALYDSVMSKLFTLPDSTRVFVGHDYQPGGRDLRYQSTIGEEKLNNIQLNGHTDKAAFVALRHARDRTLEAPRLMFPSIRFNLNGGRLPVPEEAACSGRPGRIFPAWRQI